MLNKSVSVIIAAYNEERFIMHWLSSIFDQTLRPQEIIVVDDGSSDRTWEILQNISKINTAIKIYHKSHLEQATARNFWFTKSNGAILVFPDADYYFDRKFIECLVKPIINGKAVATFTNEEYIANPDNVWSKCWNINAYLPIGCRLPVNSPKRANNFRAILRSEFERAGGFSETGYSNDITVLNKLCKKDAGLAVNGAVCFHYNPHTLAKVYSAAYRKGRKGGVPLSIRNFFIFLPFNSLRKGFLVALKEHMFQYLIFKLVFDFGIVTGISVRLILAKLTQDTNLIKLGAKY